MATTDAPVTETARYDSLDILRGVAVLMIFSVNIRHMVQPFWTQGDPTVWTGRYDLAADRALQFLVDGKWVAIFAILFGAGLMLLHDKAVAAGVSARDRIVKRQAWLIGFGVMHLLFVWLGDILMTYGVVGLVAMTLLARKSATVAVWATASLALGVLLLWGSGAMMGAMTPEMLAESGFDMPALIAAEVAAKQGAIPSQLAWRAEAAAFIAPNVVAAGPMVLAYMLVGVLAFRSGFLLARWPLWQYLAGGAALLLAAWSIDAWRIAAMGVWDGAAGDHMILVLRYQWASTIEGLLGGLGWAALVMGLVKAGFAFGPLAAAGRMAFTNYIACSLIGTTLAAGHGGDLLGKLTLVQSLIVVAATWAVILIVSPLWLRSFRYGPLEWLWRSLSYGERQPFRRRSEARLPAAA